MSSDEAPAVPAAERLVIRGAELRPAHILHAQKDPSGSARTTMSSNCCGSTRRPRHSPDIENRFPLAPAPARRARWILAVLCLNRSSSSVTVRPDFAILSD